MPRVCSDCLQQYQKLLLTSNCCSNNEKEEISFNSITKQLTRSKREYCKKIGISILKFIAFCFIALIIFNIAREIYHEISICLWIFALNFINPFLKILICSFGLFFICFKDKFFNENEHFTVEYQES